MAIASTVSAPAPARRHAPGAEPLRPGHPGAPREPAPEDAPPGGLTACVVAGRVLLSSSGCATATSYRIRRGAAPGGPLAPIATVTDPLTYLDAPPHGIWYYALTAVTPRGETGPSNVVRAAVPTELRLHLPLDQRRGTVAVDASGLEHDGRLLGGASWGPGRAGGHALSLDGRGGHLALPDGVLAGVADLTVGVWVLWRRAAPGALILDLAASGVGTLALAPDDGAGRLRLTLAGTPWCGAQAVLGSAAVVPGRWTHVAVALSGTTATLYLDGAPVGGADGVALAPFTLGATARSWLGRSRDTGDARFDGSLQDLRVYAGALGARAIAALAR